MIGQNSISVTDFIRDHIHNNGPVSFRDFMNMALYEPGIGYYTSHQNRVGKKGDFMTGPSITSLFGAIIGKQIVEMWKNAGEKEFTIVEFGAGSGQLCHDILNYIAFNSELINKLSYCIIEKNGNKMQELKSKFPGIITLHHSIEELPEFSGCVLSNELVDNFPFHRVVMRDQLMEVYVDFNDGFAELLMPARDELKNYIQKWKVSLPQGYYTEINLDAKQWIMEVSTKLNLGYMLTIDYGYTADELYNQQRKAGTMMCYKNHNLNKIPYVNIGKQDITAHVNFSSLCQWGFEAGLQCCGLVTQAGFLLSLGIKDYFIKQYSGHYDIASVALTQARLNNMLLVDMGNRFKVLIQKKGDISSQLSGLNS